VGDAHGPARRDRLRRGLGAECRRGRVLVAPRRLAEGRPGPRPRPLRPRPGVLAPLSSAPERRRVLRRAHDRAAVHSRAPGGQGDDLSRAPEGGAPRRPQRGGRAGEPRCGRTAARAAVSRLAPTRGPALLAALGRSAPAQGRARLAGLGSEPAGPDPAPGARVRGGARRTARGVLRLVRRRRRRSRARGGGRHSRRRHEASGRPADDRAEDGSFRLPDHGRGAALSFSRPGITEDAVYAGEASVLVEIDGVVRAESRVDALEERVATLERGLLTRARRRMARR
jgi:hypothetical protein